MLSMATRTASSGVNLESIEVNVGVGQHACPQVGVLGLGPIIIREDVLQGALLGCSHQDASLPYVTNQEIELPLVYDQPLCQPFSVNLAALGKGLGSIRGYFGLNILGKLNTFV